MNFASSDCRFLGLAIIRKSSTKSNIHGDKQRIANLMEMEFRRWEIFNRKESNTHIFSSRNLHS